MAEKHAATIVQRSILTSQISNKTEAFPEQLRIANEIVVQLGNKTTKVA